MGVVDERGSWTRQAGGIEWMGLRAARELEVGWDGMGEPHKFPGGLSEGECEVRNL